MPDITNLQMDNPNAVKLNEKSRIYVFPGGDTITLTNVVELIVRPSNSHRLKTGDGKLHIIPSGWIHIEIDADNWTV